MSDETTGGKTIMRLNPARNPVLGNMPPEAMEEMLDCAKVEKYVEGDVIINEGEPSDSIYFVTWGQIAIMKGGMEIDRQKAGGVIGEMGVLTGEPRSASIKCLEEVEVLKLMAEDFNRTLDKQPSLLRALLAEQMGKVTSSQQVRVDQQSDLEQAVNMLGKVVSPQVMEKVLKDQSPEDLLRGTLNQAAILFFDIKGFSSASEKLQPDVLLRLINEHIAIIDKAITEYDGFIANYIGDAVLAVFNYPIEIERPAAAAINSYFQARKYLNELAEEKKKKGHLYFDLGAGINFGGIVTGAMGTPERFNLTVLGDEVNLAARLEGLTRQYPVEVILSASCFNALTPELAQQCVRMDRVQVKGRKNPEDIYALVAMSGDDRKTYEKALETYLAGRFAEAAMVFGRLKHLLAQFMRSRCAELQTAGIKNWPGHYSWGVK